MAYRICEPTNLAATLGELLGEYGMDCDEAVEKAVDKTTKDARKLAQKYAQSSGIQIKKVGKEYIKGFSSKVTKEGHRTEGEVGNRPLPGLVHLIEKGHAKIGGGRTRAFPHMEPAFDDAKKEFLKTLEKEISKI